MEKKKNVLEEIKNINKFVNKKPTLKETLMFHEDENPEMEFNDSLEDEPQTSEEMPLEPNAADELINKIRKMALDGLSQLADQPESESYQQLKKIWQFCEKKPAEKKENSFG
jgi:hypothetical protein